MKLILVIINHDDVNTVTQALAKKSFFSAKPATTGGSLMAGNVIILVGVSEEKVQTVIDIIREYSHGRKQMTPITTEMGYGYYPSILAKIVVGNTTIFVVDIERFGRVWVFMNLIRLANDAPPKRQLELETARRGLSHVHTLNGPAGSSKRALAGPLAAALVCDYRDGALPCLSCIGCHKAEGDIYPDIVRVGGDEKDISVAQVCALCADAYIRPNGAERKVYILEDARTMNASAQNAMPRLLGEGPAYATFLLFTDDAAALLLTVCSRCEYLLPPPVTQREAGLWLDEHYPDQLQAVQQATTGRCEGLPGRVAAELEEQAADDTQTPDGVPESVHRLNGGDELTLLEHCVALEKWDREQLRALLDEGVLLLWDALVCSVGTLRKSDPRRHEVVKHIARALSPQQFIQVVGVPE